MFEDIFKQIDLKSYSTSNLKNNYSIIVEEIQKASPFLQQLINERNASLESSSTDNSRNVMKVIISKKSEPTNVLLSLVKNPNVFVQILPILQQIVSVLQSKDTNLSGISTISSKFINLLINSTKNLNETLNGNSFQRELTILYTFDTLDSMVDEYKTTNKKDHINRLIEVTKTAIEEMKYFIIHNEVEKYVPIVSNLTANIILKSLQYSKHILNNTDTMVQEIN